ncbi:hypothetical protein FSP39_017693 [Pinctada imbricata]|uniref:GTPase Era, mitochondrial n=1 Tax=Pinctada imbricata TaxID=66713 RepID=A0AA89BL12_PINIB|nr:hypothetical protein FSP39_017693 [Pinctada imbricata]
MDLPQENPQNSKKPKHMYRFTRDTEGTLNTDKRETRETDNKCIPRRSSGVSWCTFVQHVKQLKQLYCRDVTMATTSGHYQRSHTGSAESLPRFENNTSICHDASDKMVDSEIEGASNTLNTTNNSTMERAVGLFPDDQKSRLQLPPDQPDDSRVLKVAIIGAPNSGKSTLTNSLMSWKLLPVSTRAHTTRNNTSAVLTDRNTQIIFLDTPGVVPYQQKKKHNLDRKLILDPERSLHEADMVAVLVDAADKWTKNHLHKEVLKLLHLHNDKPSILVLNKVDAVVNKTNLLEVAHNLTCGHINGQKVFRQTQKTKLTQDDKIKADREFKKRIIERYHAKKMASILTKDDGNLVRNGEDILDNKVAGNDIGNVNFSNDSSHNYDNSGENKENNHEFPEKWKSFEHQDSVFSGEREGNPIEDNGAGSDVRDDRNSYCDLDVSTDVKSDKVEPDNIHGDEGLSVDVILQRDMESYVRKMRDLDPVVDDQSGWPGFHSIFMVSATEEDGVEDLRNYLLTNARPGSWEYNSSVVIDEDPQTLAKMVVWEKLLDYCPGYVPFQVFPKITIWEVDEAGTLCVIMELDAKKPHFAKLIKGEENGRIVCIRRDAEQELRNMFQQEVFLQVKVTYKLTEQQIRNRKGWQIWNQK